MKAICHARGTGAEAIVVSGAHGLCWIKEVFGEGKPALLG